MCGRSDHILFELTATQFIVSLDSAATLCRLTQMGSDPYNVCLKCPDSVREGTEAAECLTNRDTE